MSKNFKKKKINKDAYKYILLFVPAISIIAIILI